MKVFCISLLLLLTVFLLPIADVHAQGRGLVPIIDGGDGYGEAPATKKKNLLNESKDVVTDLWQILNIDRSQIVDPTPTIIPTIPQQIGPVNLPTLPSSLPSTTNEGVYADKVVQIILSNCFADGKYGIVTSGNTNCLFPLSSIPMNNAAIYELINSALPYRYLQCVGCARAMGTARDKAYNGYGNAKEQAGLRVSGYTYYENTIATYRENWPNVVPGSMFIITAGPYGHIGYMTEVYRDADGRPYAFKAFECNWGANGIVRHDKIWPLATIAGWQKPNNL